MEEGNGKVGLIRNRGTAIVVLILTAFVATLTFRAALLHRAHQPHWLLPLDFLLPTWAAWAANVAFYAYLIWLCIVFFRGAIGMERFVVAGWFFTILLSPLQSVISNSAGNLVQYIKTFSIAVSLVAVALLVANGGDSSNTANSGTSG